MLLDVFTCLLFIKNHGKHIGVGSRDRPPGEILQERYLQGYRDVGGPADLEIPRVLSFRFF